MKTAKRILLVVLMVVLCLSVFAACKGKYTVNIVAAGTGVASQSVKVDDEAVKDGDKLREGTELTVTWAASSGYVASLHINDTKTTHTSPAKITIEEDTKIEIVATVAQYTVTIVQAATGITAQSVKNGTTEVATGAKLNHGTSLTVTWTAHADYNASLYVNDAQVATTSPATVTVSANTKIEVKPVKKQFTVTIVAKGTGVSAQSVKNGTTEVATGTKVDIGTSLTITWTAETHYQASLYVNDVKQSGTTSATVTVSADTKIEIKAEIKTFTVTIVAKGTGVDTQTVKRGSITVNTGSKVDSGTEITITWTAATDYVAELYINDVKKTVTSPATITVTEDTKIEIKAALKQFYATIDVGEGVKSWSVKAGTEQIESGSTVIVGTVLTFTFKARLGYLVELYIGGEKHSTLTVTVSDQDDVDIEFRSTELFDDTISTASGLFDVDNDFADGNFTGHYIGRADGVDITANVEFKLELNKPSTTATKYTRVFAIEQLSGISGNVQLLVWDSSSGEPKNNYWDILNNWAAIEEHRAQVPVGEQGFMDEMVKLTDYTGFWGSVKGNTLAASTGPTDLKLTQTLQFQFCAENSGIYLITMDIYVLEADQLVKKDSYSVIVYAYDDFEIVEEGLVDLDYDGEFAGQSENDDEGAKVDGEENIQLSLTIDRPVDADGTFTRVFRVEQIDGTRGDVQLLTIDDTTGYWDVLNNWGALQQSKDKEETPIPFLDKILALEGYDGYWGSIRGNTVGKQSGSNGTTASQTLDFVFAAENEGTYAITMDTYVLVGTALELQCSYTVVVTVQNPTPAP